MSSLLRKPISKYWFACFRDAHGKQHRKSTRETDRKRAAKIAEEFERVAQRKGNAKRVRETFAGIYRQMYGEELPHRTVSAFVHDWLTQKRPETSRAAMDSYEKTMRAFLEVADDEWRSMLRFGLFTGQRLFDIANLRWTQIDLAREKIRLTARKTGKGLTLPLAGPLLRHVLTLAASADPEAPAHPRAFATIQRNQGSVSTLSNQFGDLLARAGLRAKVSHDANKQGRGARRTVSDLSFHPLRHSAVSMLKTAGIAESVVMELVGHDSVEVLRHYTHTGRDALKPLRKPCPNFKFCKKSA